MDTMTRQMVEEGAAGDDEAVLPLVLRLEPVLQISDDQLIALSAINDDLRIERGPRGELLLMPPAWSDIGRQELDIAGQLWTWAKRDGTGVAFGPSSGFRLPNTAVRAADAAWIRRSRWEALPAAERNNKFSPICPNFVIELRSPSDRLRTAQNKMAEWIANGAQLGWLIDVRSRRVYVYRPGAPVERLDEPAELSADPLLPGFVLDLREIW